MSSVEEGSMSTSVDDAYNAEADYAAALYWDERYSKYTESFEWYYPYSYFKGIINDAVSVDARVLVAGCGNSTMCEDMVEDGYNSVLGTDISRVVIDMQTLLAVEYPEIKYQQCNMCNSFMEPECVDAIIDKGLYDAILCAVNGERQIQLYIREVLRLLSSEGVFILISHHLPEKVLLHIENLDLKDVDFTPWVVSVSAIPKPIAFEGERLDLNDLSSVYFIYVCSIEQEMLKKKLFRDERWARKLKERAGKTKWKSAPEL
jgi:SAM-dependent methyltransferase